MNVAPVLQAVGPSTATLPAQALWLNERQLRWGGQTEPGPAVRYRLLHAAKGGIVTTVGEPASGADGALQLDPQPAPLSPSLHQRSAWFPPGPVLALRKTNPALLRRLHQGQLVLVQEDAAGQILQVTRVQHAPALDALFAAALHEPDLGVRLQRRGARFKLWAPTAQAVWLCLYPHAADAARSVLKMQKRADSGAWTALALGAQQGSYYTYLVDVWVPSLGLVRNRVTDPYSISLNADSQRSWVGSLHDAAVKPPGWESSSPPKRVKTMTDLVVYELHVRDFSISDDSVSPAARGKYLAFTEFHSRGMQHLRRLAQAGLTDLHLLPVFDFATVPEKACEPGQPAAGLPPDSEAQQAAVMLHARSDCFNWGYDPLHFNAPEGSYASDADDGAVRVLEFRRMVQALHGAGLRVGMDVVYNHTSAAGQDPRSVLDRIVPGYYQRLNAQAEVETSTCCANTATENAMMARLMIDSAALWARHYRISSFRFDLMGHQPREAMQRLQRAVNQAAGRPVQLLGEGWNFGEVQNGKRFVQASQQSLNGSGIASFSDRGRDAARGGGCCDDAAQTQQQQGWLNGLHFDPNGQAPAAASREDLLRAADLVRVGLAGTLRHYRMQTHEGREQALSVIDYAGQGAGYASQPGEVVNYVENHDNQTLFDLNALKLPRETSAQDRARVQVLGLALTSFSQGVAYFHAGVELMRSKSGDRNSYDSGDWFNRLDWGLQDNHWGSGLPPKADNEKFWPALRPLLADPAIKPSAADIRFTRDAFLDLLRIRASSRLFRLPTAELVQQRLRLLNTGPRQDPSVVVGHLDGQGLDGAGFRDLVYLINTGTQAANLVLPELRGMSLQLHPVHQAAAAADRRVREQATWSAQHARMSVPARSAVVFVRP